VSARDDYPIEWTEVLCTIDPGRWKDMCDEIDQLRESNAVLAGIARDHVPFFLLPVGGAILNIDGRWVLAKTEPLPAAEPLQAKVTLET